MDGWMWKLGAVHKKWKKRWFSLSYGVLSYWEKERTKNALSNATPLGFIPLEHAELEEEADRTTGYRFSFIVFTAVDRDYSLRTESESDALEWVVAIKKAIIQANVKTTKLRAKKKHRPWLGMLLQRQKKRRHNADTTESTEKDEQKQSKPEDEPYHPTFGAPLEDVLARDGPDSLVPFIVRQAIDYIETNALEVEGIFRLSGDNEDIQYLRQRFERGENVDLFEVKDPHTVSGLLKLYIRQLPEPLGTFEYYSDWLKASQVSRDALPPELKKLLGKIPKSHVELLRALVSMLRHVSEFAAINSMTAKNLAIVFAPNLFRAKADNVLQSLKDTPYTLAVTLGLIEHQDSIFPNPVGTSGTDRVTSVMRLSMIPTHEITKELSDNDDDEYEKFLEQFKMLHGDIDDGEDSTDTFSDDTSSVHTVDEAAATSSAKSFVQYRDMVQLEAAVESFLQKLSREEPLWTESTKVLSPIELERQHEQVLAAVTAFEQSISSR